MKNKWILASLLVIAFAGFTIAATTWEGSWARFDKIWIGETSDSATHTLTDDDVYIKGDVEVDGTLYVDGTLSAPVSRQVHIPLLSGAIKQATRVVMLSHYGVGSYLSAVDTTYYPSHGWASQPYVYASDQLPTIVWPNHYASASVMYSFFLPPDFSSGLQFRVLVTSSTNTGYATWGMDWDLYIQGDGDSIASANPQTEVLNTNTTPSTSNVVLTFTPNSSAIAAMAAGDLITVSFWPVNGTRIDATTEMKGIEGRYSSTQ